MWDVRSPQWVIMASKLCVRCETYALLCELSWRPCCGLDVRRTLLLIQSVFLNVFKTLYDLPFLTSKNIQLTITQFCLHRTITHDCLFITIDIIWSNDFQLKRNNNLKINSDDMRPPLSVHAQWCVYIPAQGVDLSEVRWVCIIAFD